MGEVHVRGIPFSRRCLRWHEPLGDFPKVLYAINRFMSQGDHP